MRRARHITRVAVLAGLALAATACTRVEFRDFAVRTHPDGDVVTVLEEDYALHNVPDLHRPQRLDVVMPDRDGASVERCDGYGGELIWWPAPVNIANCEGVDY